MKIYLADLCYINDNCFTNPTPLNVGFVASYALKHMPDLDISIFKDPDKLYVAVKNQPPDILALSHYAWNANLNYAALKRYKQALPGLLTVMGGPNFMTDDLQWVESFFHERPFLDFYVTGEGEKGFLKLIQVLLTKGQDWKLEDPRDWPSSLYGFDHGEKRLIHNPNNPVQRLKLNEMPSPYLSGILDQFLQDEHFAPIIETNRGCPYSCIYCVWGQATKCEVRQFDFETVLKELRYIAERSVNLPKLLIVADANFGILKRDKKIAEAIIELKNKYGFPKQLYIYATKEPTPHSIETFDILKPLSSMTMSLQSANANTLEIIGRKNINMEKYKSILLECSRRGIQTGCEFIYGLPGESYTSFTDGLIRVLQAGQESVQFYPLILNWGAEAARPDFREKHGLKTAFRLQAVTGGSYAGVSTVEYEEIVVGTNDMPPKDYFRIRNLHALLLLFGISVFIEFRRELNRNGYNIAQIANLILNDELNWPQHWRKLMQEYMRASQEELLAHEDTRTEVTKEYIESIRKREIALVPLLLCKLFARQANIAEFKDYLADIIRRFFSKNISAQDMEDLCRSLAISIDKSICYDDLQQNKSVKYYYAIDSWLSADQHIPLREFKLKVPEEYHFFLHEGLTAAFKKAQLAGCSLENAVYLLKTSFFPMAQDRIFYYLRVPKIEGRDQAQKKTGISKGA